MSYNLFVTITQNTIKIKQRLSARIIELSQMKENQIEFHFMLRN